MYFTALSFILFTSSSFGVGFAPFTDTETLVKLTEKYINGDLKKSLPAIGYDIKLMGFRKGRTINLTVAAAYVDKYVKDPSEYYAIKDELVNKIKIFRILCYCCVAMFCNSSSNSFST